MGNEINFEFEYQNERFRAAAVGLAALGARFGLKGAKAAQNELKRLLRAYMVEVIGKQRSRHSGPWPGGTTARTLSRRSGRGMASLRPIIRGGGWSDVRAGISAAGYLGVHETGATIRPKKSKYLTVPLPAALNSNGTPKKQSARQWARTFVMMSKKGNLLIVQRNGSKITPLYVLKKEVKIPARLGMMDMMRAGLPRFVDRAGERMLRAYVNGRA